MPQPQNPGDASEFLQALRHPGRTLKERYKGNPEELAERLNLKLPEKPVIKMVRLGVLTEEEAVERFGVLEPGLKELVTDVCLLAVKSAVAVGPRGGGKSQGVSFIEFYLVFIEDFDALNLGGSELQADQVYSYLTTYIESEKYWATLIKQGPLQSYTETTDNAWIRVLAASSKSVRSPHAGGRKPGGRMAGGILVIDEEVEAEASIVEAALPTINTARPSVNVRCSTFHNLHGTFAEVVDKHSEMGYRLYRWDIFDTCEGCSCATPGVCESSEQCFREDHYEDYIDPETGEQERRLKHRAYCGGKAKFAEGWIPMEEVETLWKRMGRNHNRWEVEAMGSRPTTSGHVIKDHIKYAKNITTDDLYLTGAPTTICVDWGTVAAGVTVWQEQMGDRHVLIDGELVEEAGQQQILGVILGYAQKYAGELLEVAADIGGGGNYMNPTLREEHRIPVRDVNFQTEKEAAAAAWNIYNEAEKTRYMADFPKFHEQVRGWRRNSQGRIAKGNDHLCDTGICYFAKFVDRLGLNRFRVAPRSFSAGMGGPQEETQQPQNTVRQGFRAPVARTLSS
jgi:hypothetical protein